MKLIMSDKPLNISIQHTDEIKHIDLFVSDYCQLHGMFRMLDQNPGTMCYPR